MKNYFRNLSLTKKILIVTLVMFIAYTIIGAAVQMLFFESFYTYSKREALSRQIESFSETYARLGDDEVNEALLEYTGNDTYMLILNENGEIIHSTSYQMMVKTENGERITFFLDHIIRNKKFGLLSLKKGDMITVGYMSPRAPAGGESLYMPVEIRTAEGRTEFFDVMMRNRSPGMGHDPQEMKYISGTIVSVPSGDVARNMINRDESIRAVMDWMHRVYSGEKPEVGESIDYVYDSEDNIGRYCVVVKNISTGDRSEMIFAVTTLKPVAEAVGIMQTLQIMWLSFMTIIVILISFEFTKRMTKPVVDITAVTTRMKNLDFSQKCKVTSKDEIGVLAENVNAMSEALDDAISSLKEVNEKLMDDIERERRIEQNRREFTAAVSHELKTPLAIIRAYSEGILDGVSEKKREHYLKVIADETKKMDALVLDMLDNSKLEAGAETLDLKYHSITALVQNVVNLFRLKCEAKGISIRFEAEDEIGAEFDLKRIEQVITNFISNAVRHTPDGGKVRIRVYEEDGICVTVENDGEHIAEDELDKIWDKFYKIDKSRERSVDSGTGLGLSIAKNILTLHNAKYFVRNTENGVMFGFVIKK